MRTLLSIFLVYGLTGISFAATPSFQSFDTNDFSVTPSLGNPKTVHAKNGTLWATNTQGFIMPIVKTNFAPQNVKWYGATGDGSTDDTAALQSALSNTNLGIVLFPPGLYRISAPIHVPANTWIQGSPGSVVRQVDGIMNGKIFFATSSSNIVFQGLTVQGNEDSNPAGTTNYGGLIDVRYCNNFKILDCDLSGARARAIDIRVCSNFVVSGCYVHDTGINKGVDGFVVEDSNGFEVIGNRVYNSGDDLFATITSYGFPSAYDPATACYNYTVTGNTFDTCNDYLGGSVALTGHDFTFSANTITYADKGITNTVDSGGIRLTPSDVSVTAYRIRPYNALIANNVVTKSGSYGMKVEGTDIVISGNTVSGSGLSGIKLYSVQDTNYLDSDGLQITAGTISVDGNNISNNRKGVAGVELYAGIQNGTSVAIQNNNISGNANGIYAFLANGVNWDSLKLINNVISSNADYGVHLAVEASTNHINRLSVVGNTFRDNSRGFWQESAPNKWMILGNQAYSNSLSEAYWYTATPPVFSETTGGLLLGVGNRDPATRLEVVQTSSGALADIATLGNMGTANATEGRLLFRSRNYADGYDIYSGVSSQITDSTNRNSRLRFWASSSGDVEPQASMDGLGNFIWDTDGLGSLGNIQGGRPKTGYFSDYLQIGNAFYFSGRKNSLTNDVRLIGSDASDRVDIAPDGTETDLNGHANALAGMDVRRDGTAIRLYPDTGTNSTLIVFDDKVIGSTRGYIGFSPNGSKDLTLNVNNGDLYLNGAAIVTGGSGGLGSTNRWLLKGVVEGVTTNVTININGKDYILTAH